MPETTPSELERATTGALAAYRKWRDVPIQQRQRVFFRLQQLIREHTEELAVSITTEQGGFTPSMHYHDFFSSLIYDFISLLHVHNFTFQYPSLCLFHSFHIVRQDIGRCARGYISRVGGGGGLLCGGAFEYG